MQGTHNTNYASTRLPFLMLASAALLFCSGNVLAGPSPTARPEGLWSRAEYGELLVVDVNENIVEYEFTQHTCLNSGEDTVASFTDEYDIEVSMIGGIETVTLRFVAGGFEKRWQRVQNFPILCEPQNLLEDFTPTNVFDHFTNNFSDYYAFFQERGIDWNARVARVATRVSDNISNRRLKKLLIKLVRGIDDGHIVLELGRREFSPEFDEGRYEAILEEAFDEQDDFDDLDEYSDAQLERYAEILDEFFFDSGSFDSDGGEDGDAVQWATMANGTVGYISLEAMDFIDPGEDPSELEDVNAINAIMPNVIADLRDTQATVIDIRFNTGGWDTVSLAVATCKHNPQDLQTSSFSAHIK